MTTLMPVDPDEVKVDGPSDSFPPSAGSHPLVQDRSPWSTAIPVTALAVPLAAGQVRVLMVMLTPGDTAPCVGQQRRSDAVALPGKIQARIRSYWILEAPKSFFCTTFVVH